VFDAKKVTGHLTVRRAQRRRKPARARRPHLQARSLDLRHRDEHGVESLAGIMGGETSGCDENTTTC
jgi:phenylalanyl-tRNA synthetase beta chain